MMNLTLIRPYKNGITANKTTSVNIKHVVVSDANGYCIRLEQARDTTVSLGKLNNCSMSGIEVIAGRDTSLDSITFTYMSITALSFQSQSENTSVTNSKINNCLDACINISSVSNTTFKNVSITEYLVRT